MKHCVTDIRFDRDADHVNIAPLCVSSVGNIEGTLKQTNIHLLRQIYSEVYDITRLINDTYLSPFLLLYAGILQEFYITYFKD